MIDSDVLSAVFPHLDGLAVESIRAGGRVVQVLARTRTVEAGCPGCGVISGRVHGRYVRRLSDMAVGGREMVVLLTVRRFRCGEPACRRRTFAEQVPDLAGRYQRRTRLLTRALSAVAVMLAGRPGARLSERLGMAASRSSMLRLLRAVPQPQVGTLRAVGIDDFALRRGHIYGTVVIDMDTHRPVEVLPDRAADSVADWLMAHPGIEVICRDRAPAYAEAGRTGAPMATQVADRWHLFKNLAEAVGKIVTRYRRELADPDPADAGPADAGPADAGPADAGPADAGPADAGPADTDPLDHSEPDRGGSGTDESIASQSLSTPEAAEAAGRMKVRTIERHQAIHALLEAGHTRAQISRQLGLDPHTVRRYAAVRDVADMLHERRTYATILDTYKAHLHRRWNEGVTNAEQLHQEIAAMGYLGSAKSVRRYLQPLRTSQPAVVVRRPAPSIRQVTEWLTRRPEDVCADDTAALAAILARCPALVTTQTLVREFATMLTHLTGHRLPAWLERVTRDGEPELRSYAAGLRKDLAAVTAGLTLPYSSGAVEGNVNRIKTIKRQMYGRASFDLLRHRILLRA